MLQKDLTTGSGEGDAGLGCLLVDVAHEVDGEAKHEDLRSGVDLTGQCDEVLHGLILLKSVCWFLL